MNALIKSLSLILLFSFSSIGFAQNITSDMPWQKIQDWHIFRSKNYQGCVAAAVYQSGTRVRLGFDGIIKGYFVSFSNGNWTGFENLKNYELIFFLNNGRTFKGYFHMINRDGLPTFESGDVNINFLEGIAEANVLNVRLGDVQLASLSLKGSRRALNAMVECERAGQYQ